MTTHVPLATSGWGPRPLPPLLSPCPLPAAAPNLSTGPSDTTTLVWRCPVTRDAGFGLVIIPGLSTRKQDLLKVTQPVSDSQDLNPKFHSVSSAQGSHPRWQNPQSFAALGTKLHFPENTFLCGVSVLGCRLVWCCHLLSTVGCCSSSPVGPLWVKPQGNPNGEAPGMGPLTSERNDLSKPPTFADPSSFLTSC